MRHRWRSRVFFLCLLLVVIFAVLFVLSSLFHKPTIIFIPGLDLTARDYTTLISGLEKEGYVVEPYEPTYRNRENPQEMVALWTKELSHFIGDQQVILIGHSVGGATVAHFCAVDSRCIAGINLDGGPVFDELIPVPFLYLQGEIGNYCDQECLTGRTRMEKITNESGTQMVQISGIKHFNFTDKREQTLYNEDYLGTRDGRDEITKAITQFLENLQNK